MPEEQEQTQGPSYTVNARIKEFISTKGCRTAGDLVDELNKQIIVLLDKAIKRCKDNGRETVGARDL